MEDMLGMRSSALCEEFGERIESLVRSKGHLVEYFRSGLMTKRAEIFADAIHEILPLSTTVSVS